jgi:hypothetical protein
MNAKRDPDDTRFASYVKPQAARPITVVALLALSACTTTPRLAPLAGETPVAFVVAQAPPAQDAAAVHDTALHDKSGSGAKIGTATGALLGLACGPFLVICVPAGALTGAAAGGITGVAIGVATTLPKETVAQLNERLQRLQKSNDPVILLRTDVLDQVRTHWEIAEDTSHRVVTLEVQGLSLTSTSRKKIALVMQVLVHTNAATPADTSRQVTQKRFEYVSKPVSLATWLDETGEVPETILRNACQQIATEVISELAAS